MSHTMQKGGTIAGDLLKCQGPDDDSETPSNDPGNGKTFVCQSGGWTHTLAAKPNPK